MIETDDERSSIIRFSDMEILPRKTRDDHPVAIDSTPVKVRGEALAPIWWRGRQWAVTEFGLECLDGTYPIEKSRLREGLEKHCWPEHMTEKNWVNADDFITAWLVALAMHGNGSPFIRRTIGRSIVR